MPQVPQGKRQVFEEPIALRSRVEAPAEAFGGGSIVQSKQRSIGKLATAAEEIIDDFDKTEVKRARRELQIFANDQNAQFKLLKNKAPTTERKSFDDNWEKEYERVLKTLGNDKQKSLLVDIKGEIDVSRKSLMGSHQLSEAHNYQNEEDQASINAQANIAADNYQVPALVAKSISDQEKIYKDYALRNGDAIVDEKTGKISLTKDGEQGLKNSLSKTHYMVVARAINEGNDREAKAYFDSIKKDKMLTAEYKDKMLKLVDGSSKLGEAQRFADMVVSSNMDKTTALAEARKKYEGEEEVLAVREIKLRFDEKNNATREFEQNVFRTHMDALDSSKGSYQPKDEEYLTMTPEKRQAFDRRKASLLAGKEPVTNWAKYSDLTLMASNPATKHKFMQLDPIMFRNDLADAEFKEIVKLHKSMLAKDDKFVNNFFSVGKQLEASYKEAGIKYNPKIQSHKERRGRFESYVQNKVLEKQDELKRKLSDPEIQDIIDQALIKGSIEDGGFMWFDKEARVFEVKSSEMEDFTIEGYKPSDFMKVQKYLKDNKMPSTQEDVIKVLKDLK